MKPAAQFAVAPVSPLPATNMSPFPDSIVTVAPNQTPLVVPVVPVQSPVEPVP